MEPDGPDLAPGLPDLAKSFDDLGYRSEHVRGLLGVAGDISTTPADLIVHQRRLADNPGPLADVVSLLTLGFAVPAARASAALGVAGLETLVRAGAVVEDGGAVMARIRLMPHGDLWLASDRRPDVDHPLERWYVTPINPPATLLAAMTVRREGDRGLDIGTGNGVQAILLAQHCSRVVATDINPRALRFAAFNAALNGCDNIQFRLGNLLEPVAGERFDVVVCNPPYVISPDNDAVFRDSGEEPGALCAELVGQIPSHLSAGGFASVLASWPVTAGQAWSDLPASWLRRGCQAWLVQLSAEDTLQHARQWNLPRAAAGDLEGFGEAIERWVDYTSERRIERIGYGAIVLREHAGEAEVIRADEVRVGHASAGPHIQRIFAAHDVLARLDHDVSAAVCTIVDEHQVERGMRFDNGAWRYGETQVTLAAGLGLEVTLDPLMTEVFIELTSGRPVAVAAREAGLHTGLAGDDLDKLVGAACAMAHQLIALGIVIPQELAVLNEAGEDSQGRA
jgi:methylase of polypeptide subunit release factors